MSEGRKNYKVEIVNNEDVLNEIISINNNQALFVVRLEDGSRISDLEYLTVNTIREMIENDDFLFLKVTEI